MDLRFAPAFTGSYFGWDYFGRDLIKSSTCSTVCALTRRTSLKQSHGSSAEIQFWEIPPDEDFNELLIVDRELAFDEPKQKDNAAVSAH